LPDKPTESKLEIRNSKLEKGQEKDPRFDCPRGRAKTAEGGPPES